MNLIAIIAVVYKMRGLNISRGPNTCVIPLIDDLRIITVDLLDVDRTIHVELIGEEVVIIANCAHIAERKVNDFRCGGIF